MMRSFLFYDSTVHCERVRERGNPEILQRLKCVNFLQGVRNLITNDRAIFLQFNENLSYCVSRAMMAVLTCPGWSGQSLD
jgi:hypothetical protein